MNDHSGQVSYPLPLVIEPCPYFLTVAYIFLTILTTFHNQRNEANYSFSPLPHPLVSNHGHTL